VPIKSQPAVKALPIEAVPLEGEKRLTLNDVEEWCSAARASGVTGTQYVQARVTMGGWAKGISAIPGGDARG
jgi:hypothetical protein